MCFVFPADVVVLPGPSCDTPVTGVGGQELEQTLGGSWCSGMGEGMGVESVSFLP